MSDVVLYACHSGRCCPFSGDKEIRAGGHNPDRPGYASQELQCEQDRRRPTLRRPSPRQASSAFYGVVGDSLNGCNDSLRHLKSIEWIHVRHEEGATFAALRRGQLLPCSVCRRLPQGNRLGGAENALTESLACARSIVQIAPRNPPIVRNPLVTRCSVRRTRSPLRVSSASHLVLARHGLTDGPLLIHPEALAQSALENLPRPALGQLAC